MFFSSLLNLLIEGLLSENSGATSFLFIRDVSLVYIIKYCMDKYSIDLRNLRREVKIDYFKSSGPGGQHKNKTMSCVRLLHKPTGIRTIATESRSQIKNRELALKRLQVKLLELNIEVKERIPTKEPNYVKQHVRMSKRIRAVKKQLRKKIEDGE